MAHCRIYIHTMPRKARLLVCGAFHHIMARGIDGRDIFTDAVDREKFLSLLGEGIQRHGHRLYGWALLSNHYHLLLKTSDSPLSEMMARVQSTYARYFNARFQRHGYLFQDRYRSIVTQDQNYVEELLRYIHLNPLRAGICKNLEQLDEYPWCGHGILVGTRQWSIQETDKVLLRFGTTIENGRQGYRLFLKKGLPCVSSQSPLIDAIRESNRGAEDMHDLHRWVIGDPAFMQQVFTTDTERRLRLARYDAMNLAELFAAHAAFAINIDQLQHLHTTSAWFHTSSYMVRLIDV